MKRNPAWQRIYPRVVRAEKEFAMLEPGDRILAAISGGPDSLAMLDILLYQQSRIGRKMGFEVVPAHVPGSYRGRPVANIELLRRTCLTLGTSLHLAASVLSDGIYTDCFRCSQVRRKLLFDLAQEHGCNKIALGHNADDLVETFLLNIFYSGRLAAVTARQSVIAGKLVLIRPLIFCWKSDILEYVRESFGRIRSFHCPGGRDSQRQTVRRLLDRLSKNNLHLKSNLLRAITNHRPEYLPASHRL